MSAIRKAIEIAGSEAELARLTNVSPQAINKAVRKNRVSPDLALAIEKGLDGRVTKESLVWPELNQAA